MLVSVSGRRCVGAESVALCFMRLVSCLLRSFMSSSCRGILMGLGCTSVVLSWRADLGGSWVQSASVESVT